MVAVQGTGAVSREREEMDGWARKWLRGRMWGQGLGRPERHRSGDDAEEGGGGSGVGMGRTRGRGGGDGTGREKRRGRGDV